MINVQKEIISLLKSDTGLATLMNTTVPNLQIYTGPRDVVIEKQSDIKYPLITLTIVSENDTRMPLLGRETRMQLNVWSRTSEMEVVNVYDRVNVLLSYQKDDTQGTTKIWYIRQINASESFSTEVRLWGYSIDMMIWSYS